MPASDRNSSRALPLLPQMVPSATCVRCDVCCRFPEADSFLRPYFTEQEIIEAVARGIDPAHFPDRRGGQLSLAPNPSGEGFLCPAFDPATSHCRIYEGRPLDCRLYPLTVMWTRDHEHVVLGWDAKCPFMRDSLSDAILAHAERVLTLLEQDAIIAIFAAHPRLVGRFQDDVTPLSPLPRLTGRLGSHQPSAIGYQPLPITISPFTVAYRLLFERACASIETPLAAYALAPHLIWRELFTYTWAEVDGHLCLFAEYADGIYMPLPPLPGGWRSEVRGVRQDPAMKTKTPSGFQPPTSNLYPEALAACFAYMQEQNRGSAVSRIENVPVEWTEGFEAMGYRMTAKDPDYVYRTADLVALAGDPYKSQRAACNRVLREYRCEIGVYRPEHREACLALFRRWRQQQEARPIDGVARFMLADAESAHREALINSAALGLMGHVVQVDGAIRAYTFGYARSRSVFCVLLEVADRTITGLGPYVFRECCREAAANGFTFINTMDDSGLPHLAAAKRAYHPLRLVPSSIATFP